jgi:hypothetical protein
MEIMFYIRQIKERGLVTGHGEFTVYLDSPLAIEATTFLRTSTRAITTRTPSPIPARDKPN